MGRPRKDPVAQRAREQRREVFRLANGVRESLGLPIRAWADKADIKDPSIISFLQGESVPEPKTLAKLLKALRLPAGARDPLRMVHLAQLSNRLADSQALVDLFRRRFDAVKRLLPHAADAIDHDLLAAPAVLAYDVEPAIDEVARLLAEAATWLLSNPELDESNPDLVGGLQRQWKDLFAVQKAIMTLGNFAYLARQEAIEARGHRVEAPVLDQRRIVKLAILWAHDQHRSVDTLLGRESGGDDIELLAWVLARLDSGELIVPADEMFVQRDDEEVRRIFRQAIRNLQAGNDRGA